MESWGSHMTHSILPRSNNQPGHNRILRKFTMSYFVQVLKSNGECEAWGLLLVGLLFAPFLFTIDSYFFPDPLLLLDLNCLPSALHPVTNYPRMQTHCSPNVPATLYHRADLCFCSTEIVPHFSAKWNLTHLLNATSEEFSLTLFTSYSHWDNEWSPLCSQSCFFT